jgi:protein-tyrosine phosphatase
MVVTAYLMYKYSWTLDDALAFVRTKREGVRPNPAFRPLLDEWERELRKSKDS